MLAKKWTYVDILKTVQVLTISPDVATEKQLFLHFLTFPSAQVLVVDYKSICL